METEEGCKGLELQVKDWRLEYSERKRDGGKKREKVERLGKTRREGGKMRASKETGVRMEIEGGGGRRERGETGEKKGRGR